MEPLTVALPKGRLLAPAADLFQRLGWRCDLGNGTRQLQITETRESDGASQDLRFLLGSRIRDVRRDIDPQVAHAMTGYAVLLKYRATS